MLHTFVSSQEKDDLPVEISHQAAHIPSGVLLPSLAFALPDVADVGLQTSGPVVLPGVVQRVDLTCRCHVSDA